MALLSASAAYARKFFMVLSSDHVTPATGRLVTADLSKGAAAFAVVQNPITEIGLGFYVYTTSVTDTNTVGDLSWCVTASNCDTLLFSDQVVNFNPGDNAGLGLSRLDAAITSRLAPIISGRTIDVSSIGLVTSSSVVQDVQGRVLGGGSSAITAVGVKANVEMWTGSAVRVPTQAGAPVVEVQLWTGSAVTSLATTIIGTATNVATANVQLWTGTPVTSLLTTTIGTVTAATVVQTVAVGMAVVSIGPNAISTASYVAGTLLPRVATVTTGMAVVTVQANAIATTSLQSGIPNLIADGVLRRQYVMARTASLGDSVTRFSLLGAIAKLINKVDFQNAPTATIYHEDGATTFYTQTLITASTASPVVTVA